MTESNHITPTKSNPIFVASNSYFGYIEENLYKETQVTIDDTVSCMATFALSFTEAIVKLHTWIEENSEVLQYHPNTNFEIHLINGDADRYGDVKMKKVYTITAKNAFNLLSIK